MVECRIASKSYLLKATYFQLAAGRWYMPVISAFYGITIKIFHGNHNPPHIHIIYGEFKAQIEITTGRVLAGRLPPRSHKLVKEGLKLRQEEVIKAWEVAGRFGVPKRIKPLE
jgi:hypothetical protein